ncbi:hypothetical protein ACFX19_025154 [Malus domestica]
MSLPSTPILRLSLTVLTVVGTNTIAPTPPSRPPSITPSPSSSSNTQTLTALSRPTQRHHLSRHDHHHHPITTVEDTATSTNHHPSKI